MKLVKLAYVLQTLKKLESAYEDKKILLSDNVRQDHLDDAKSTLAELESLGEAIKQMKNLDVQIGSEDKEVLDERI